MGNKKYNKWTPEDVTRLKCLWGTIPAQEIADILNRNVSCLRTKAYDLQLSKERKIAYDNQGRRINLINSVAIAWSPQMIDDLRRMYPNTRNSELAEYFNVSIRTLTRKASQIGLSKAKEFTKEMSQEFLRRARLVNMTIGNSGQFKKGMRASPATEFGAPNGNKPYRQARKNGIQSTRVSEESYQVC